MVLGLSNSRIGGVGQSMMPFPSDGVFLFLLAYLLLGFDVCLGECRPSGSVPMKGFKTCTVPRYDPGQKARAQNGECNDRPPNRAGILHVVMRVGRNGPQYTFYPSSSSRCQSTRQAPGFQNGS